MDVSILILLAAICVAVAVMIGYLLGSIFSGKSSEPPPEARQKGLERSFIFYADQHVRQFILQIDGKTVEAPHLLKETQRRQLLLLYQALSKWLNVEKAPLVQPSQAAPPQQASAVAPAPPGTLPELPTKPETSLFPDLPNIIATTSAEPSPAKRGVADWLAQALQPKSSVAEPPKSIVMQVDEILQRKLLEKGWQQRGIRLLELPDKGMVVLIGLNQYATVNDVPDAEIRSLIRDSVIEWETMMLGG